jgi:YD repeat-containing protein
MTFKDSLFAERPMQAAVTHIQDRYGNALILTRNSAMDLTRVTSPNGRWIELTHDTSHRITEARDNLNRAVQYTYDASGRLWKVTDVRGGITEYTYDAAHRMLTIKDPRGIVYLTNEYDGNGRVIEQTQADSSTFQFNYTLDGAGKVTQTDMTDPRGFVRRVSYNAYGRYLRARAAAAADVHVRVAGGDQSSAGDRGSAEPSDGLRVRRRQQPDECDPPCRDRQRGDRLVHLRADIPTASQRDRRAEPADAVRI